MSLSVGIVGLPNVGKSTLFNALATRRLAETAPRPFTTIEPHEAVVPVPDGNLEKLHKILVSQYPNVEVIPATVTFIDIAGLVKGASHGEGLGNQFLGKIREVDAVVHVVRVFKDEVVAHVQGKIDPKEDIEIVNLELELGGITGKPVIYVFNCSEGELLTFKLEGYPGINISAKLEEEMIDFSPEERKEYLGELGIGESGLERLIKKAYEILGLITFYTIKGGKELHAWSLKEGATALEAAAQVHTDFAKNFIKAEAINANELLSAGGWKEAKEKGGVRLEGKDYIVADGDVIEFMIGR
jgi:hypothetical protein